MPILWQGQVWHKVDRGLPILERLDGPMQEVIPFPTVMSREAFVQDLVNIGEAKKISYEELFQS